MAADVEIIDVSTLPLSEDIANMRIPIVDTKTNEPKAMVGTTITKEVEKGLVPVNDKIVQLEQETSAIQTNVNNQLQAQDVDFQQKAAAEFEKNKNYVDGKSIEIAPASVTPETLSEATKQLINTAGGGSVTNLADDEDLVSTGNVLKFKDKAYQPSNFSGLGRKILRKNIDSVSGKNILTQAMVNMPNTIYEVQYDYDLNGATITIPDGCIINFTGGKLYNGVVIGDKMPTNVQYTPEQFGAGLTSNDNNAIQSCLNVCRNVKMTGNYNVYAETTTTSRKSAIQLTSDLIISIEGNVYLKSNIDSNYAIFMADKKSNILIKGGGYIIGDNDIHVGEIGEHGMGIDLRACESVTIDSVNILKCWGDGIYVGPLENQGFNSKNITIKNCSIYSCRRQGISVTACEMLYVIGNNIYNISGTAPSSCLDIERQWSNFKISEVLIKDNYFHDSPIGIVIASPHVVENISVLNHNDKNTRSIFSIDETVYLSNCCFNELELALADVKNCSINSVTVKTPSSFTSNSVVKISNSNINSVSADSNSKSTYIHLINCSITNENREISIYILPTGSIFNCSNCFIDIRNYKYKSFGSKCIFQNCYIKDDQTFIGGGSFEIYNCFISFENKNSSSTAIFATTSDSFITNSVIFNSNKTFNAPYFLRSSDGVSVKSIENTIVNSNESYTNGTVLEASTRLCSDTDLVLGYKTKGTSTQRPSLSSSMSGFQYYDTTLKKYICWNGTSWTNLDGSVLA